MRDSNPIDEYEPTEGYMHANEDYRGGDGSGGTATTTAPVDTSANGADCGDTQGSGAPGAGSSTPPPADGSGTTAPPMAGEPGGTPADTAPPPMFGGGTDTGGAHMPGDSGTGGGTPSDTAPPPVSGEDAGTGSGPVPGGDSGSGGTPPGGGTGQPPADGDGSGDTSGSLIDIDASVGTDGASETTPGESGAGGLIDIDANAAAGSNGAAGTGHDGDAGGDGGGRSLLDVGVLTSIFGGGASQQGDSPLLDASAGIDALSGDNDLLDDDGSPIDAGLGITAFANESGGLLGGGNGAGDSGGLLGSHNDGGLFDDHCGC